jgi:hypothetical protein
MYGNGNGQATLGSSQDCEMDISIKTLRITSVFMLAFISLSFDASVTVSGTSTALPPGVVAAIFALLVYAGSTG